MNYKTYGNKKNPTFLILHGWGGSSKSWEQVAKYLETDFFVIIPDIPCASKLADCGQTYSIDNYSDLVFNFIQKLELEDFVLLGHSNGGAIATKLVTKYPELKIKKLILNNSAGIRKDKKRSLKRKIFGTISKLVKPVFSLPGMGKVRNIFYRLIGGQDYLEAEKNPNKKQTYLNMINEDLQSVFPQIQKDTLLIWGENDTYTPLSDGQKIHSLVKNSKLEIIKNVRHGIHLQNPQELVKVILKSLE